MNYPFLNNALSKFHKISCNVYRPCFHSCFIGVFYVSGTNLGHPIPMSEECAPLFSCLLDNVLSSCPESQTISLVLVVEILDSSNHLNNCQKHRTQCNVHVTVHKISHSFNFLDALWRAKHTCTHHITRSWIQCTTKFYLTILLYLTYILSLDLNFWTSLFGHVFQLIKINSEKEILIKWSSILQIRNSNSYNDLFHYL